MTNKLFIKVNESTAKKFNCLPNKNYEVHGRHKNGKMTFTQTEFLLLKNEEKKFISIPGFSCELVESQQTQS